MKKILFASEYFWPRIAGGEVWSFFLCSKLVEKGYKVVVLTSKYDEKLPSKENKLGIEIIREGRSGKNIFQRIIWQKRCAKKMNELLNEEFEKSKKNFDIIHTMAYGTNAFSSRIAKKKGIPSVTSIHSFIGEEWKHITPYPIYKIYQYLERKTIEFDKSDILQVPSSFTKNKISESVLKKNKSLIVIPNTIITPKKEPLSQEVNRYLDEMKNGKHFLCAGSLIKIKRFSLAIEAIKETKDTLWIIGEGPEENNLKKIANGSENIKFIGSINSYELRTLMKKATAVIIPSYTESFSLIAIEAASMNTKVIGTPVGVIPDIDSTIIHNKEELVQAINNTKEKKKKEDLLNKKKRKEVILSNEEFIRSFEKVYDLLAKRKS